MIMKVVATLYHIELQPTGLMIPKIFVNEAAFPHFAAPFAIAPGIVRADFSGEAPALTAAGVEVATNANIESILQIHRRKMLRRAANRRSAQLSRARKKAHMEELKQENSRLQRLVDVLDSQPELVFCVTAQGKLTYISERTINFIKINMSSEDSDEDPTHVSQILTKESVDNLLETIAKLQKHTQVPIGDTDLNMLFAIKEVYFHDTFGHPVMGYLRCSKVHRRTSLHDLQSSDSIDKAQAGLAPQNHHRDNSGPPAKKAKKSNSSTTSNSASNLSAAGKDDTPPGWNMSNFKILTDYASAFTEDIKEDDSSNKFEHQPSNSNSTSSAAITDSTKSGSGTSSPSSDEEEEFVCVIRTTDNCFIQYRSHSDMLLFSSVVPGNGKHDFDLRATLENNRSSPSDSNSNQGNTGSDNSSRLKTGTSSETGSDDNNIIEDEN